MRAADPSSKALVFSQFQSTLDLLKQALPGMGFTFKTITGGGLCWCRGHASGLVQA